MLTSEERENAVKALALAIMKSNTPRSLVISWVAEAEFGMYFPLSPQNAIELAREAIRMCEADQWRHVPPWLQQILRNVPNTPIIQTILDKANAPPLVTIAPTSPDAFSAMWLPRPRLPFVNRVKLRDNLRALNAETGPSVLFINGPPQSGKSYSVELIYHVTQEGAAQGRPVPVGLVRLEKGMGASLAPEVLARLIAEQIACPSKPLRILEGGQDKVTPDRLNEHLCDWIVDQAAATGDKWWVVLDGLNDPDLPPVTRNFISKLVELLSTGKHRKRLRLVVIDYPPEAVGGIPPSVVGSEQLSPIGEVDLESFMQEQLTGSGGTRPTPQAVRTGITLAMLGLPEDGTRLKVLNQRLKAVVETLNAGGGNG